MRVAVACDHAGFPLKQVVLDTLQSLGHEILDLGTNATESVDYPDYALKLGQALQSQQVERGILLCGSGVGACIAANKLTGIYAGVCHDSYSARQGVEHDRMNVLCLGTRIIGPELIKDLVRNFMEAQFIPEERHIRRTGKVAALEQNR